MTSVRFAIVGCGLIGQKRAAAIARLGQSTVVAVDRAKDRAVASASRSARVRRPVRAASRRPISMRSSSPRRMRTFNDCHSLPAGWQACAREKLAGRNLAQVSAVAKAADTAGRVAKVDITTVSIQRC